MFKTNFKTIGAKLSSRVCECTAKAGRSTASMSSSGTSGSSYVPSRSNSFLTHSHVLGKRNSAIAAGDSSPYLFYLFSSTVYSCFLAVLCHRLACVGRYNDGQRWQYFPKFGQLGYSVFAPPQNNKQIIKWFMWLDYCRRYRSYCLFFLLDNVNICISLILT